MSADRPDGSGDIFDALRLRGQRRQRAIELATGYGLTREAAERAVDEVLGESGDDPRDADRSTAIPI